MSRKHNSVGGEHYLRSRSISEPEINFDKGCDRFKPKHFPFEYIPVDDLHYYRRRKPCNCKKNLFRSTLNLCNNKPVYKSEPSLNGLTEYRKTFIEKPCVGKLPPLKRPPNLKVDAYPFLTGLYRSDSSINNFNDYKTSYEQSYHERPFSPRIGPLKRPPNIKLNPGVMDIRSEQKSQYLPYQAEIVSRARPPAVRKPNNLRLIGNIELLPEYKTKFIPYTFDNIERANKVHCFHSKTRDSKCKRDLRLECDIEAHRNNFKNEMDSMEPRKLYHNNDYGARFHEKTENGNNYMPEYRSKYRPVVGERSTLVPQPSHFVKHGDDFDGSSEYSNQYKTYDHFAKSAPIKKEDNLYMKGQAQMKPEYKDRYKEIDYKSYTRRQPYKQQNNLHSDGNFPTQMPEYSEKYKNHSNTMPERSKGREDFLQLTGDLEYDTLHRENYVEFPRQRPIVRKPATHIKLADSPREERKPDNLNLPINVPVPYHSNAAVHRMDDDEVPLECTPEYRKAMRSYMIRERSPSRGTPPEAQKKVNDKNNNVKITVDHNDVTKILTENRVNQPEEKIVNEHNEVIVEPLKKPDGFKIPTRSPTSLNLGRGPTYPIDKDKFNEIASVPRKPRKHFDVSFDDDRPRVQNEDFDFEDENNNDMRYVRHAETVRHEKPPQHPNHVHHVVKKRTPPKYGRRAPNPKEDYAIRKKTSVIEGNSTYNRDFCSNRHEGRGFPTDRKTNALPFAPTPADSLSNNYRPNYELDKQQSYREALGNREPFVVLDRELHEKNKLKQSGWMKKQWYDTQ